MTLFFVVCLFLCGFASAGIDVATLELFIDRCFVKGDSYLDDGGFCTDFKTNQFEAWVAIRTSTEEEPNPTDAAQMELLSGGDDLTSTGAPATSLLQEHKLLRGHHHHHRHRHHKQEELEKFTQDPIANAIWPKANIFHQINTADPMTQRILEAMQEWKLVSCLDFIPAADNTNGLLVFAPSTVGRCACPIGFPGAGSTGNAQFQPPPGFTKTDGSVLWATGCPKWTLVHELGHGAGLQHTQTRQDRNTYVTIANTIVGIGPQNYAKADSTMFTDEPLSGAFAMSKADEFYDSIELYPFDANNMKINQSWAVTPGSPTPIENVMAATWANSAGQRNHLGSLDIRTVNNKYQCFPVQLKNVGANAAPASFMHKDQTIGQLAQKLGLWSGVDPISITLWTGDDLSQEHTAQPLTTALSALTTPITANTPVTIKLLTNTVKFVVAPNTFTIFVDLGWTLNRVLTTVKFFDKMDWTAKTISKGTTALDATKTLTVLIVANGDTLTVT